MRAVLLHATRHPCGCVIGPLPACRSFSCVPRYNNGPLINGEHQGDFYLKLFEFQTDNIWIGMAYLFNFGMYVVLLVLSAIAVNKLRYPTVTGTARIAKDELQHKKVKVSTDTALPFTPATLSWSNLSYAVPVKKQGDKVLITDIHGAAVPGRMVALMGASGAGKTTLIDVLAHRKYAGTVSGNITVNGKNFTDASTIDTFRRIAGYVQQLDSHISTTTVREAFMYSARLRLPKSVTHEQRVALVNEVLDLLELDHVADWLVGGDAVSGGVSPGQRKRVTIGVELCANPVRCCVLLFVSLSPSVAGSVLLIGLL